MKKAFLVMGAMFLLKAAHADVDTEKNLVRIFNDSPDIQNELKEMKKRGLTEKAKPETAELETTCGIVGCESKVLVVQRCFSPGGQYPEPERVGCRKCANAGQTHSGAGRTERKII